MNIPKTVNRPAPKLGVTGVVVAVLALWCLGSPALAAPEIRVTGNGQLIASGDATPSPLDGTDFGAVQLGGAAVKRVFFIYNDGADPLTVTSVLTAGAGFAVSIAPQTTVAGFGVTSVEIQFTPAVPGVATGSVSVSNSDSDENPYVFAVQATVKAADIRLSGKGVTINNGDTIPGTADGTDFGTVTVGGLKDQQFTIHNDGDADLNLSTLGTIGLGFSITGATPGIVSSGDTAVFTVRFAPSTVGLRTGTVTISSNDPDESPYAFVLQGTGTEPEIEVLGGPAPGTVIVSGDTTPSAADGTGLAAVSLGLGTSNSRFTVRNLGSGDLIIAAVTLGGNDNFSVTPAAVLPLVVAPGGSSYLDVVFHPGAAGTHSTTLTIQSNDQDEGTHQFTIDCTALAANMNFGGLTNGDSTPDDSDGTGFGSALVGGPPVTHPFTVANAGPGTLQITAIDILPATHFSHTLSLPAAVAAGGSMQVPIVFTPHAVGTHTAVVTVRTNDPAHDPFTFTVSGTGTQRSLAVGAPGQPVNSGDLTPDVADGTAFGSTLVGGRAITRAWPLRNTGNLPLRITSITSDTPAEFVITGPGTPLDIAAGASVSLTVRFAPAALGTRGTVIRITSDDPLSPFVFAVGGAGSPRIDGPATDPVPPVLTDADWAAGSSGDYSGAIYQDDGHGNAVDIVRGGFDSFRLNGDGTFTAKGALDGTPFSLKGALDPDGSYAGQFTLSDGSAATVEFQHATGDDGSIHLTGTLRHGSELFHLDLIRSEPVALPASLTGRYTMIIPARDDAPVTEPHGDGVVDFSVRIDGRVRARFALGDGSQFTRHGQVSPRYVWQFHTPIYDAAWKSGFLSARLVFRDVPGVSDIDGTVYWRKAPNAKALYYPGGFAIQRDAIGAKYVTPPEGTAALPGLDEGPNNAEFWIGSSGEGVPAESLQFTWSDVDKITETASPRLKLKVNRKTGIVSGTYNDSRSNSWVNVYAGILQKQNRCGGRFKGYRITGFVTMTPATAVNQAPR